MEDIMDIKLLNVTDVSKTLSIAKSTLYAYTAKNEIPHLVLCGKIMFDENDLLKWIKDSKKSCGETK
jgi:predicted DNA-binding transcriptional regulator AlpA